MLKTCWEALEAFDQVLLCDWQEIEDLFGGALFTASIYSRWRHRDIYVGHVVFRNPPLFTFSHYQFTINKLLSLSPKEKIFDLK